jgi:uncharacterized membrane protein
MLKQVLASTVTILLMDAVWLSTNLKYHTKLFESVQQSPLKIRLTPAILVYILMPLALYYFAIYPSKTLKEAALKGALLGLSMYGLYDLTNLSTLSGWTIEMALKDTLWGTVLCCVAASAGFYYKSK